MLFTAVCMVVARQSVAGVILFAEKDESVCAKVKMDERVCAPQ
jgi:hypothetical protein